MADPRIEHGVEHVDDEVDDHEAGGHEQHDALQDHEVAGVDGADQQPADARQGEDGLDDQAPPIRRPILMPATVTSVSDEGFRAWTSRMRAGFRPLALAMAM